MNHLQKDVIRENMWNLWKDMLRTNMKHIIIIFMDLRWVNKLAPEVMIENKNGINIKVDIEVMKRAIIKDDIVSIVYLSKFGAVSLDITRYDLKHIKGYIEKNWLDEKPLEGKINE